MNDDDLKCKGCGVSKVTLVIGSLHELSDELYCHKCIAKLKHEGRKR